MGLVTYNGVNSSRNKVVNNGLVFTPCLVVQGNDEFLDHTEHRVNHLASIRIKAPQTKDSSARCPGTNFIFKLRNNVIRSKYQDPLSTNHIKIDKASKSLTKSTLVSKDSTLCNSKTLSSRNLVIESKFAPLGSSRQRIKFRGLLLKFFL